MACDLSPQKVLIFIVAYNAETTLPDVLDRIPASVLERYRYEILIIDDSSQDKTFTVGNKYLQTNKHLELTVLYNPVNQGYGGNQKLGYVYAIENDFEVVVMIHGDGQYPPEMIENVIDPILNNESDAVFGTRMAQSGSAIKGGMPIYKYAGNKILTFLQNKILGSKFSEFHSGFRAYSTRALKSIPFEFNTNDFHFDTQIIIQFLKRGLLIKEIPIPTHYGEEVCHVNGIKYARDIIATSILSRMHNLSILYQREYDLSNEGNLYYSLKLDYPSSHSFALDSVTKGSKVLDIGCNQGQLARELKSRKKCQVVGIDNYPLQDPETMDEFWLMELDEVQKLPVLDQFDHILLLDVIEHLSKPELFMDVLRRRTKRKCPKITITTGNIAFFIIRLQLLWGQFNYGKQGILDLSHKRLFSFSSLKKLLTQCGYHVGRIEGIPAPFPKAFGNNIFSRSLLFINNLLIKISRSLFSYQIAVEATIQPVVSELLKHSIVASQEREHKIRETFHETK